MIYITSETDFDYHTIKNVWESDNNNLKEDYKNYMIKKAKDLNIIINEHWLNMMNHNNNEHLTKEEFKKKNKQWSKILKDWTFEKYISYYNLAKKVEFIEII